MATQKISYGLWTAMTVTNLASLASDVTDPFGAWQSVLVDNFTSVLADDYQITIDIPMTATAPAATSPAAYVYTLPWSYSGSVWIPGGNFGTTTDPTGSEGTASVSDPNTMAGPLPMHYKVTSQDLQLMFEIGDMFRNCPQGWSLVIRNATGAAFGSSGITVAYRPIFYTVA